MRKREGEEEEEDHAKIEERKKPLEASGLRQPLPRSAEADDSLSPQDRERGENRVGNFYIQDGIEKRLSPMDKGSGPGVD